MITLQNLGDSILFTFDENDKYLNNGTISVPMNSLILVTDDSDMATFRKAATNDIFVSALYSDFGMTKAELEEWYAENMVSEVTEEDVDEKIAEAVGEESERAISAETALSGAIDTKIDESAITSAITSASTDSEIPTAKAVYDALQESGLDEDTEKLISGSLNDLNERKLDVSAYTPTDLTNYYTKSETSGATEISTALASKADTATTYNKTEVDTALAGKQSTLVSGTNIKTINNESILGGGNIDIQGGGKAVSGGTNISITTGETADTINCTLPITATTGSSNIELAIGENATAQASYNSEHGGGIAIGYNTYAKTEDIAIGGFARNRGYWNDNILIGFKTSGYSQSVCIGSFSKGYNDYQAGTVSLGYSAQAANMKNAVAIGANVSTTDTIKTNLNNQIKIDSSNQVYISNSANTSTYCLQEKIENTESALGGLKLVKLTQSEYDALATKDSNTLFIING